MSGDEAAVHDVGGEDDDMSDIDKRLADAVDAAYGEIPREAWVYNPEKLEAAIVHYGDLRALQGRWVEHVSEGYRHEAEGKCLLEAEIDRALEVTA